MALTQTQVSQLYVSIFNRASEGEGNSYWQAAGKDMATTANTMLATADAKAYFGTSLDTNQAFIEHIYLNTLGKTYAQDKDGVDYWVARLDAGESKGDIIAAIITAAQSAANAGDAQDTFNNKVAVSDYSAQKLETVGTDLTSFQDLIKNITADASTVTKSKQAIDAEANSAITGDTQYLSVSQDIKTGTAGNDAFISYVAQNQNGQQVNTLGSGDVINGGAGNDTLDAQVTAGAYVNGGASSVMAIAPITTSVENVVLHAEIADFGATSADNNDLVIVNAKYMNGVETIASNYSDASLLIQNMTTKGVSGGTAAQTVAMEYTGNADSKWDESNMTVFYDQDYLTRSDKDSGASLKINFINTLNLKLNQADKSDIEGFASFDFYVGEAIDANKVTVDVDGLELSEVKAAIEAALDAAGHTTVTVETYEEKAHFGTNIYYENSNSIQYNAGEYVGTYTAFVLKNSGPEALNEGGYLLEDGQKDGSLAYSQSNLPSSSTDTPVSINVDLEKVGLAADGGSLIIGSMNKDGKNEFYNNQAITVTETVAGFDEFNVSVAGDKTKNSSLSALHSTDNTLRKVTIDSKAGSTANLTIGNSNTGVTFNNSANNAQAFKDVQIMDASSFAGDLTLNAGFTSDIVAKYLNNITKTTLYGLNNAADELASFDYNGGAGNDTLNLALNLNGFALYNFVEKVATEGTNGLNVFKMDINGGNGDDTIIVDADAASAGASMTNITIDGGLGDDLIDISSFSASWSYNVAFSGTHFGHDTVKGFNVGEVQVTDEAQTLNLAGFEAHTGEVIKVTVGNVTTQFTVTADLDDAGIATQVASMLAGTASGYAATQQFTTDTSGCTDDHILTLAKTDANVNSVTVEIISQVEANGTYDKDTTPIHTATSVTHSQGGLLNGATGADTLDFSAYNVKGVVINNSTTDIFGTNAATTTTASADIFGTAGNKFIYLEASAHDAEVYNVYMATSKAATAVTDVNFGATGNATKGDVIGSINLQNASGNDINLNTLDASQLLF